MFNPNNLDEVCVQATHIESKGKYTANNKSNNPFKSTSNKFKGKWKDKKTITIKKDKGKREIKECCCSVTGCGI